VGGDGSRFIGVGDVNVWCVMCDVDVWRGCGTCVVWLCCVGALWVNRTPGSSLVMAGLWLWCLVRLLDLLRRCLCLLRLLLLLLLLFLLSLLRLLLLLFLDLLRLLDLLRVCRGCLGGCNEGWWDDGCGGCWWDDGCGGCGGGCWDDCCGWMNA